MFLTHARSPRSIDGRGRCIELRLLVYIGNLQSCADGLQNANDCLSTMEPCSHALEARQAETVARSMLSRINYPWWDYIGTHHCQGLVAKQIDSNLSISVDLSNTRLQGIDTAG